MKRLIVPTTLISSILIFGCSTDDSSNENQDSLSQSEQNEEAVVVVAENIALESGGMLEGLDYTLENYLSDPGLNVNADNLKDESRIDEPVFDPETCTWTNSWERSGGSEIRGFTWAEVRSKHFMDIDGACIETPPGDGSVKGIDFDRSFDGETWSLRHNGQKSGSGDWAIRELNDEITGARINGTHSREGNGEVLRLRDGTPTWINHEFTFDLTATDLLIVRNERRHVPIEGTIHIVYHAVHGDNTIDREVTLVFGDDGGRVDFANGDSFKIDPETGTVDRLE
jgi:hypothetical protein